MKLLTRSIYALLFMGFSLILNAGVEPTVSIRSQKGPSFSIHLKDTKNETYNIKLSDNNGFVLLNEKIENQDEYLKLFNLKNLPSGNYRLRIENERKIILQNIDVFERQLIIAATKREIFKPTIRYKSSYLSLDMSSSEEGKIRMIIKDKKDDILYKEDVFKKGNINKRFDMTALPAGDYFAEVMTDHYTYTQKFSIGVDNKLNLQSSTNRRKKLAKKGKGTTEVKKYKLPSDTDAIMSKIKWIQSQKN